MQIFGRAGRPQFDTSGHGVIITTHDKLAHFLSLLTRQFPIESSFIKFLADNLNAEVALGTVTNLREAVEWLSYTYLFVRMRRNPMEYGIKYEDVMKDRNLVVEREKLIRVAAMALDKAKMIRWGPSAVVLP
jgi:activating signal cointegrator complex subunit 3